MDFCPVPTLSLGSKGSSNLVDHVSEALVGAILLLLLLGGRGGSSSTVGAASAASGSEVLEHRVAVRREHPLEADYKREKKKNMCIFNNLLSFLNVLFYILGMGSVQKKSWLSAASESVLVLGSRDRSLSIRSQA